jgi:hypothetical protein
MALAPLRLSADAIDTSVPFRGIPGFSGVTPATSRTTYTQTYATADTTVPAATQLTPPAGGTGATEGAYDTAANRDLMIASITAGAADLLALKKVVNKIIDDLQAAGLVS